MCLFGIPLCDFLFRAHCKWHEDAKHTVGSLFSYVKTWINHNSEIYSDFSSRFINEWNPLVNILLCLNLFNLLKDFLNECMPCGNAYFDIEKMIYRFSGNYSFLNLEIVANSNSCRNVTIFYLKFIYSEKATKFCEVSTIDLKVTT